MPLRPKLKAIFLITIFITFVSFQFNCFSQAKSIENVFVHLSKNLLLSGSELKYTAYITTESNAMLSTIIYFELMDCNQMSVLNWKMSTNNAWVSGYKNIPESLPNGIYYFTAYTNKIRNYPIGAIHTTPILIQRIYEDPIDSICYDKSLYASDTMPYGAKNEYFQVEISEGEDITLLIKPQPKLNSANISISLTEQPTISNLNNTMLFHDFTNHAKLLLDKNTIHLLPIEHGYSILSGRLLNRVDSTPLKQKLVYLSYPDSTLHFNYFNTTVKGEFCFLLDSTFDNRQLYLQTNNLDCTKDSVSWVIDNKNSTKYQLSKPVNIAISETEKDYLSQLQKREIIHRVYHPDSPKKSDVNDKYYKSNVFQMPSYIIKPSDYVELSNFKEICNNILPSVRFKEVNHNVQIGMVIDQQVLFDNVLISVNGIPCFNMNYIINLASKDIKQIEIYNSVLIYGDLTFNGVIAIYTNKNGVDERTFCDPFYTFENKFYAHNYDLLIENKDSIPAVNPNIYWNPSLAIQKDTPTSITLSRPEIGNVYVISILGLINNTIPFEFKKEIKMKN